MTHKKSSCSIKDTFMNPLIKKKALPIVFVQNFYFVKFKQTKVGGKI
jgi:hypothetical protein